jgi:hypothetical protein
LVRNVKCNDCFSGKKTETKSWYSYTFFSFVLFSCIQIETFGEEYLKYQKDVPYRIIPYIFWGNETKFPFSLHHK